MSSPLLSVEDLKVFFPIYGGVLRHKIAEVRAVDGVSFELARGETLGLVGESGSGKTTVGRAIINLITATSPDAHLEGSIRFRRHGEVVDLNGLARREMFPHRAHVQMIFQDPFSSLNPRMTVEQIVGGPLKIHTKLGKKERWARVLELLERVGLQPEYAARYPHEFSGGQRQRIGIARALATNPDLIIADEPVSALDVSVQAQVINLMMDLQAEFGISFLFIAHDISIVYHVCDRIAVMYLGNIVEVASAESILAKPRHPYTRALLSAIPEADPERERPVRVVLEGDIPSPLAKPSGCGFRTRCPIAQASCAEGVPPLVEVEDGHTVACPYSEDYDKLLQTASGKSANPG